jgi:glycosyltransferase involved in cell wall biosynthesis
VTTTRNLRIAVVLPRGYTFDPAHPNSIETVVRTFAAFTRHDVTVFADGDGKASDIPTRRISGTGRRARNRALAAELRAFAPDLIEAHQHIPTAYALAKALPQIPVVLVRHNIDKEPVNPLRRWWHGRRLWAFAGIVFVSRFLRDTFLARHPALVANSHVIQNAIDTAPWRAEVAGKEKLIVYSGRALEHKGFDAFCYAAATLLENHPDWRVEICALAFEDDPYFAAEAVEPLEAFGDRFTLHKDQPMDMVRSVVKRAAILVIPSEVQEAFGLVALEAHAAGCAVVTSGRGGLLEASGDHAVVLPAITGPHIVEACAPLIADKAARETLARAGQAFVETGHNLKKRTADLDDLREKVTVGRN